MPSNKLINVFSKINKAVTQVWDFYTKPEHIIHWNNASPDWHTPSAKTDFQVSGKFSYRMEAIDGSQGFDFSGKFLEIKTNELIRYVLDDGRRVTVNFLKINEGVTHVNIVFEAETKNTIEDQKLGWQAILDNFKKYCESTK